MISDVLSFLNTLENFPSDQSLDQSRRQHNLSTMKVIVSLMKRKLPTILLSTALAISQFSILRFRINID